MFILFGFGKKTIKELGSTEKVRCGRCNNVSEWRQLKVTTWFTLFFIPTIPYKMVYAKECPICRATVLVDKNEIINSDSTQNSSNKSIDDGLTDVQRNYNQEMQDIHNQEVSK